jgi:ubiquitin-protein ligase E3 C
MHASFRFVMNCSRPPLLEVVTSFPNDSANVPHLSREFKELVPNFSIRDAGQDGQRLPTASTCVNLLKVLRHLFRHSTTAR